MQIWQGGRDKWKAQRGERVFSISKEDSSLLPGITCLLEESSLEGLFKWLSNPSVQKTLAILGGGLVVLVGAVWRLYLHISERKTKQADRKNHLEIPKEVDPKRCGSAVARDGQAVRADVVADRGAVAFWTRGNVSIHPGLNSESVRRIKGGSIPPFPSLFVGRGDDLTQLKTRLGAIRNKHPITVRPFTIIRGLPGVGKTTLISALAHDKEIQAKFVDGILWTSLGLEPSILSTMVNWYNALGPVDPAAILHATTVEAASGIMRAALQDRRMLLIVDDVWDASDAVPFQVGGKECGMVVTTRETKVAETLAPTPAHIYVLQVLPETSSIDLLEQLAPTVVSHHPREAVDLVKELEGLPLALQVAGRLLNTEADRGFSVSDLLKDLREGKKLLEAAAPVDLADLSHGVIPTVKVLLSRSTDRLDPKSRERFALLGPFAPKPSTFDLKALQRVWEIDDPTKTLKTLLDRGLLEPVGSGRFQMHSLLVTHARSLLDV